MRSSILARRHPRLAIAVTLLGALTALVSCRTRDAGTQAQGDTSTSAMLLDESRLVDLTYALDPHATTVPMGSEATHLDAPAHLAPGQWTLGEIPLEQLIGPAAVIDVSDSVEWNPGYLLTVDDVLAWEERNGPLPGGAVLFIRTGWSKHWPDRNAYFGTPTLEDSTTFRFPGISEEAATFLAGERFLDAIGVDTPSLDAGGALAFPARRVFARANVPALENVANLRHLPEKGAWVLGLPVKLIGGVEGPVRIVAVLPAPIG